MNEGPETRLRAVQCAARRTSSGDRIGHAVS